MEKLEIKHYEKIKEFARIANYEEYNSNPVTMMMWNHYYEIYCDFCEHYVLLLVKYPNHYAWLMPLCEKRYLHEAISHMKQYSLEHGLELSIHGMIDSVKKELENQQVPFIYTLNIQAQDYVYDIEMHKTLVGKKMQKRRNHFNAFMKEYQDRFYFRDLIKEDEEMVLNFLNQWKETHRYKEDIENEEIGIQTLFTYFHELKIHGGCIFIDDELKGFSMYSELSERMIQMHVEKADKSIRGCSVALLKYTLMNCDPKYTLMNREDDLGLEELRKAKSDLHPIFKIKKYTAIEGNVEIMKANESHLSKIQELWLNSFEDEDEESMQFYFDRLYDANHTYLLMAKDVLISMVQVRFMDLMKDEKKIQIPLIFGVATNKEYQGCGYMRKLLNHVLEIYESEFILIQAYYWDVYRSFGFKEAYTLKYSTFVCEGLYEGHLCNDAHHLLQIYLDYVKQKDGYRLRDLDYYTNYFIPYKNMDHEIYANQDAYIVVNKEHTYVNECCYRNEEALKKLLNQFQSIDVLCDLSFGKYEIRNVLMARGNFQKNDHLFISEIL